MKTMYDKSRHARYKLVYHLVVATEYRRKCLTPEMINRMREISELITSRHECKVIEFGGESDHVHLLFEAPPKIRLTEFINVFKSGTSRRIRKEYKSHLDQFYMKDKLWTNSYLIISSGGAPIEIIKKYIQEQDN
ncbi:IS200/IS605 family transposase [Acidaminobacter sp. JC074]|uniref:IS200/IS605 family transposase n=1 Tax=Acidaminobacter sp. JC074 TaxID=2530199 RepID=UPI001F103E28|nr:IS200/IS605 family transposase [Acidaminobacter sp. JC074]MCH4887107.1 IS200/IS605 family transposase [Acidaminobacter sp. JC074]